MPDLWYIARDGQTFGPYSPEQVQELSRIQPLLPSDQMLRAGTQEWRPALAIDDLFAAPEPPMAALVPEPEPEVAAPPPSSPSFGMEETPSPIRTRRKAKSGDRMPMRFWLVPMGGAAILGILTVVVMVSGRSKPTAPPREERRPPRPQPRVIERPAPPRVEVPPPPTDYSVPKADYTKGYGGEKVKLLVDTPPLRREGFVTAKGKTVYHGKTEEFYPDSDKPKSEEWYADNEKHGPATAWDEAGAKTTEGQYFRGAKQGKWSTFRKGGGIATEEMWYRGKKLGPSTTFHANGKKARTMNFKNDRRTGPAEAWDEAGNPLTPDESLRADLQSVTYEEMVDVLDTPTEVHEAPKEKGSLHIWATPDGRYIAVWVTQDRQGVYTKRDVRAFLVKRDAIDKLKRELR